MLCQFQTVLFFSCLYKLYSFSILHHQLGLFLSWTIFCTRIIASYTMGNQHFPEITEKTQGTDLYPEALGVKTHLGLQLRLHIRALWDGYVLSVLLAFLSCLFLINSSKYMPRETSKILQKRGIFLTLYFHC